MAKYYYKKGNRKNTRKIVRFLGGGLSFIGFIAMAYFLFPVISWQIFIAPRITSQDIIVPIPKYTIFDTEKIKSYLAENTKTLTVDTTNVQNWFSGGKVQEKKIPITSFTISIPKLGIENAFVSTVDYDLSKQLVSYQSTAVPGEIGTAFVHGHSTLPQLFDPKNYKAIFATLHTLRAGDEVFAQVGGVSYKYKIYELKIVSPDDTSIYVPNTDDSYLTLITCTPPGTTWRRLMLKTRLVVV